MRWAKRSGSAQSHGFSKGKADGSFEERERGGHVCHGPAVIQELDKVRNRLHVPSLLSSTSDHELTVSTFPE